MEESKTIYVVAVINGSGVNAQAFGTREKMLDTIRNTFREEAKVYAERMGFDNDFDIEESVRLLENDGYVFPEFTGDEYYMKQVELH